MIYRVKLNYHYFTFADRGEALDFAEMAMIHTTDDLAVEIRLVAEEEVDHE